MFHLIKSKGFMVAMIFAATMVLSTAALQAQITGEIEAKVPFEFNAENTRFPAGHYFIRPAQEIGDTVLEIFSADNKLSVFVMPVSTQTTQAPKDSELLFDKIGPHYFLRGIVVQDSLMGYDFPQSKVETTMAKGAAKVEKHRLIVTHHKTKVSKR